jgi:hypothetical protein
MEQPEKFTSEQRKALADMLKPNGSIRDEALTRYRSSQEERRESLIRQMAEETAALPIVAKLTKARDQVEAFEHELTAVGFRLDCSGELGTSYGAAGASIRKLIDKRTEKKLGSQNTIVKQFDSALLKVWTVATLEEAKAIVEALL